MFVLENHYSGKPTILIHNRIINGCQNFTLEEADSILVEVWGLDNLEANTSKLIPSDEVLIKGLGVFDYKDFLEFNFD